MGVPITLPKVPTLEMVKVLPLISSEDSLFVRAFSTNRFTSAARISRFFLSAFLTTGTIKLPVGSAVAIPILMSGFTIILLPSTDALMFGKSLIAFATASINNGVKVSFSLYLF